MKIDGKCTLAVETREWGMIIGVLAVVFTSAITHLAVSLNLGPVRAALSGWQDTAGGALILSFFILPSLFAILVMARDGKESSK